MVPGIDMGGQDEERSRQVGRDGTRRPLTVPSWRDGPLDPHLGVAIRNRPPTRHRARR